MICLIALSLLAWGTIHMIGSWRGGETGTVAIGLVPDYRRGLVVLGCMVLFLTCWGLLLLFQKPCASKFRVGKKNIADATEESPRPAEQKNL